MGRLEFLLFYTLMSEKGTERKLGAVPDTSANTDKAAIPTDN